jgi:hypothetical protein
MKITFHCDNNANIHSEKTAEFTPEDLGLTDAEWLALSDDEKNVHVSDWAHEDFDYWYSEEGEDD